MTRQQAEMQWNATKVAIAERKAALKLIFSADQATYAEKRRKTIADYNTKKEIILKDRAEFTEKLHKLKRDGLSEYAEQLDAQRRLIAQCDKELRMAKEKFDADLENIKTTERAVRVKFENDIAEIKADGKRKQIEIFSQIEKTTNPDGENVSE